jgi:hypothetical protein
MPPAHVALVIFQIGLLHFSWTAADHDPPTLALICCNYRCWPSCPSCSLRWGLHNFFAQVVLELWSSRLYLSSSLDYRHKPLCMTPK